MKAGIITFHNTLNYGAILQTYGLQTALRELDCKVSIIDHQNPRIATKLHQPHIREYRNYLKFFRDKHIYNINVKRQENLSIGGGDFY